MAKFKITDQQSGKSIVVSGDAPPSDQEAEQIFSDAGLRAAPKAAASPRQAGKLPSGLPDTFLGFDMRPDPAALARLKASSAKAKKDAPQQQDAQPTEGFLSDLKNYAAGMGQAYYDLPQSAVGLALEGTDALGLTDNVAPTVKKAFRDSEQGGGKFFKGGRMVGDFLETLPVASLKVAQGATLLPTVLNGAAQGATSAALTSQNSDASALGQVALGAGAGGALSGALYGAGKLLSTSAPTDVQTLTSEGVPLTIGQRAGGTLKRIEDRARSLPIIGGGIRNAQQRSVDGLNRAVANRVLEPIGGTLPDNVPVGRKSVEYVQQRLNAAYTNVLGQMSASVDQPFIQEVDAVRQAALGSGLPDAQMSRLNNIIKQNVAGRFTAQGNQLTGDAIKSVDSELRRQAKGLMSDASFDNRELGQHLEDIRTAFKDMLMRQNPQMAPMLKRVDRGWANYAVLRAAQKATTKDAAFAPSSLSVAVRQADKSVGKGRYAAGKALMQDLSDAASTRLPNSIPDSGTAERMMNGGALLLGLKMPAIPAALLAGRLGYSGPVQKGLVGLAAGSPTAAAMGQGLQRLPVGFAGGALVPQILSK